MAKNELAGALVEFSQDELVRARFLQGLSSLLPAPRPTAESDITVQRTPPSEWPEDPPIPLEAPVLPAFAPDVLPPWLNDMALGVARHTETPIELAALIGLCVLATCCQRTFVIQPKPDYCEPLNIWTVVALESGNRKTSVMQHMTKPLLDADRERCEASKAEMLRVETERENIKARLKGLRTRLGNGDSEDIERIEEEIHKLEQSLPEAPTSPRLWVQDITPEKLGQTLAESGDRLAIVSDEGGVFDIMAGRYSNGVPNLDVYLQSHAGGGCARRSRQPPAGDDESSRAHHCLKPPAGCAARTH